MRLKTVNEIDLMNVGFNDEKFYLVIDETIHDSAFINELKRNAIEVLYDGDYVEYRMRYFRFEKANIIVVTHSNNFNELINVCECVVRNNHEKVSNIYVYCDSKIK